MADIWYAVYDKTSGRLFSVTTVLADDLSVDFIVAQLPEAPRDDEMWDEVVQVFVPRPEKVIVDKADNLLKQPEIADALRNVPDEDKLKLVAAIGALLGEGRYGNASTDALEAGVVDAGL